MRIYKDYVIVREDNSMMRIITAIKGSVAEVLKGVWTNDNQAMKAIDTYLNLKQAAEEAVVPRVKKRELKPSAKASKSGRGK